MPRKPTARISKELLDSLFQEFDIFDKSRDGRLVDAAVGV